MNIPQTAWRFCLDHKRILPLRALNEYSTNRLAVLNSRTVNDTHTGDTVTVLSESVMSLTLTHFEQIV
jgi:hypothetical protein